MGDRQKDKSWFLEAKYGLFIHFGLYALLGGEYQGRTNRGNAEWIQNDLDIPVEVYARLAERFDPVEWDADDLVRQARDWGMRYIVFTAKHHEGFAMYDTHVNGYSSVAAAPCRRDFVEELAGACRRYGLRLGLYYSQSQDWHDPNGYMYRKDNSAKDFGAYLRGKCMGQLRELLTRYGEISILWFDTPLDMTEEESRSLVELVEELQPACLINGRVGNGLGDYRNTGDNFLPRLALEGGWEVPATLNDTWGYCRRDEKWRSPKDIIRNLIRIVSRGGNYLLNVGPTDTGAIQPAARERLEAVGEYLRVNGEAVYGTDIFPFYPYELSWGELTCRRHWIYLHVFEPKKVLELNKMRAKIQEAYILGQGRRFRAFDAKSCGEDWMLRFELPEEWYDRSFYCIAARIEEEYPHIEPMVR